MSVVTLPGVENTHQPITRQPQNDVIEVLERILEEAKTGDVQGITFALIKHDSSIATGWKGEYVANTMMAAVSWLLFRFGNAFNDTKDDYYKTGKD